MNRFIKAEDPKRHQECLYFRTFANCLHYFKIIDEEKLRAKDKEQQAIYNRYYKRLSYWNFYNCEFDFARVSRIEFTDSKKVE